MDKLTNSVPSSPVRSILDTQYEIVDKEEVEVEQIDPAVVAERQRAVVRSPNTLLALLCLPN